MNGLRLIKESPQARYLKSYISATVNERVLLLSPRRCCEPRLSFQLVGHEPSTVAQSHPALVEHESRYEVNLALGSVELPEWCSNLMLEPLCVLYCLQTPQQNV